MLEIKNLSITLSADGRKLVDGFDFTLGRTEHACIIGEEGNGKSTLLKCIYDRALVSDYCDVTGAVRTDGRMAYLAQTHDPSLGGVTLADMFDADYYSHIDWVEKLCSLELITSERKFGTLSGGEKVRARLLRLLIDEPDVLLLDEPTNDLDMPTLEVLENFLRSVRLPVLFISHDETLIENVADTIVHMEQLIRKTECRVTVARCGYAEYIERRSLAFDKQQKLAQKQRDDYDKQMEKWRRVYNRVDHEQETISRADPAGARLLKKKMHAVQSMKRRFEREKDEFLDFPNTEDAIIARFEDVEVPRGKTVLDFKADKLEAGGNVLAQNVALTVRGGEKICIIGANGAGKSTLLDAIVCALEKRRDVVHAYMPQDYLRALDAEKTPVEYLAENYTKEQITKARTLMGSMRFTHTEMTQPINRLSGGQRAKIMFLEMVLRRAEVLVLDEPTRNFSPLSAPVVRESIRDFRGAVIAVSHDRKFIDDCDTVYELTQNGLKLVRRAAAD